MTVQTPQALSLTKTIAASPEAVFEAWTKPEVMKQWSCPDPTAGMDVEVDLRVGGAYMIRMIFEDHESTARGTYKEIDAPRRLVYTWDWDEGDHHMGVDTVVTVDFEPVEGGTQVTLKHEGFPAEEPKVGHEEGWTVCLERLAGAVA